MRNPLASDCQIRGWGRVSGDPLRVDCAFSRDITKITEFQEELERYVMQLTINNQAYASAADPSAMLLWVLRDELGLTGTKFGCGAGICGACTVHIDGVATRSCITPLAVADGRAIRTIEGLATQASDGVITLHPVQQAFIDEQVPQCGWCMSGQIMTAAAFLEQASTAGKEATLGEEEIINAMGNNYCRCGCYVRIKRAVTRAAQQMTVTTQSEVIA